MSWYLDFSSYSSFERIIEGIISLYLVILLSVGLKVIHKDRNQILNELDKLAFIFALVNMLCQTIYFLLVLSAFFLMMIRAIRLIQDILISAIFLIMLYQEKTSQIKNVASLFGFLAILLWLLAVILVPTVTDYDCFDYIWIIFSGFNLILSSLNIYCGFNSYTSMKMKYFNQMNIRMNEVSETPKYMFQEKNISEDDINNMGISLLALMGSSFVSIFIQFLWDYFLHVKSNTLEVCIENYHSYSFISLLFYCVLKGLCFWPSVCGIYYVFYHRNRNNFNILKESEERSLSVFYDFRSEYMDDETNDADDVK